LSRFADVHYYFSDPSSKPRHHRFDRGSYVYLFHNAAEDLLKIEIANHAGTPEQDAFTGYLDVADMQYSHKQPTLFSLSVHGDSVKGHDQWHLPSWNEKNEQKYLYKINALDLYLFTEKDASAFLDHFRDGLSPDQLDIRDVPPPSQEPLAQDGSTEKKAVSPVVAQLEQTAISRDLTPDKHSSTGSSYSFVRTPTSISSQPAPAYNPAAPAAPEPIAHREKTPPPPEADAGHPAGSLPGYGQSPYGNAPNTWQNPGQIIMQQPYFSGPPQLRSEAPQGARQTSLTGFPGPPQSAPSFAPPPIGQYQSPQPTSPAPNQPTFHRQTSFGTPTSQNTSYQQQQRAPSFGPHATSSIGFSGPPVPGPPAYAPSQHGQAGEAGGYSDYNYNATQQPQGYGPGGGYSGDLHSQAYQPTADEVAYQGRPGSQRQTSERQQKLEERVKGVEAQAGKLLKRLDRLW